MQEHAAVPPRALTRIGLTGGIGSGKSAVAEIWRGAGLRVIDLDLHSRAVLDEPGEGVEETVSRFGEQYRSDHGSIDRARLGELVFSDPAARADLERIVLTRVDRAVKAEERAAAAAGERFVAHDSPLLLEKHHDHRYGCLVAVLARREDRIARVVRTRDRDRAYVESVMAAQTTDLQRIRRAHLLVLNNADTGVLGERAQRALQRARERLDQRTQEVRPPA